MKWLVDFNSLQPTNFTQAVLNILSFSTTFSVTFVKLIPCFIRASQSIAFELDNCFNSSTLAFASPTS